MTRRTFVNDLEKAADQIADISRADRRYCSAGLPSPLEEKRSADFSTGET